MPPAVHYAWSTPSSQGTTTYESVLYMDGTTSCSCPGWTFQRKGKPRTCKHVTTLMPVEARQARGRLVQDGLVGIARPLPVVRVEARITATPRSMAVEGPRPGRLISREE